MRKSTAAANTNVGVRRNGAGANTMRVAGTSNGAARVGKNSASARPGRSSSAGIVERIGRAAGPPAFRLLALRRVRVGAGILVEVLHQLAQRALVQALGLLDMPVGILLPALRQVLERLFAEVACFIMRVVGALRLAVGHVVTCPAGEAQNRAGGAGLPKRIAAGRYRPKAWVCPENNTLGRAARFKSGARRPSARAGDAAARSPRS